MTWILLRGVKNEALPHFYNPWETDSYIYNLPFKRYNDLSHSQLNKLKILLNTLVYRTRFERVMIDLPNEFYEDAAPFSDGDHPFLDILNDYLDKKSKKKETVFFYFVARTIYGIDTDFKKKKIIEKLKNNPTKTMHIVSDFFESFLYHFGIYITKENHDEAFYILAISFIYYKYIRIDFTDNFEFSIFEINREFERRRGFSNKLKKITKFLDNYLKDHNITYITNNMKKLLSHTLYFILETSNFECKLKIYIDYSKNLWIPNNIQNNLLAMFNSESIEFIENIAEADITISDIYTNDFSKIKNNQFYFENPYLDQTWSELFKFVAMAIYEKKHKILGK